MSYVSTIKFAWFIPVVFIATVTGFNIAIADTPEGVELYPDNVVAVSSCNDDDLCTHAYSDDYYAVKALVDAEWATSDSWFTRFPMRSDDGYFSQPIFLGAAQAYKATGDTSYLATAIRIGQSWIDSGTDLNGDGLKDWWGWRENYGDLYNYDHHEWRAASGIADVLVEMIRTGYEGGKVGRISEWANFLKTHVWEKWAYGHKQKSGYGAFWVSNIETKGVDSVGRWTLISMGLDKAQAAGIIPATDQYSDYVTSPTRTLGIFFPNYFNKFGTGSYNISHWTNGNFRGERSTDTSHATDFIYAILRSKQLGYNAGGRIDEFLTFYQAHLDAVWFPTSAGFMEYADGSGNVNGWHYASSHGQSMGAAISPELKARWIEMVLYHEPTFSFYSNTGHNRYRAVSMGGGLLWALADNSLK